MLSFFSKASRMVLKKRSLIIIIAVFFVTSIYGADKPVQKRTLKSSMEEEYNILPEKAENVPDIFSKGIFYGRLRTNYFYWDYVNNYEDDKKYKYDLTGFGVGGSLIYKTAPFYGLSATCGFYTSQNLGFLDREDARYGRSGKDTFSRYDKLSNDRWGMTVLAQSYMQFSLFKTDIRAGRQIFESFLTRSNDTKMIPNTFEGYTLESKDIPGTTIKLAYLTRQKLRDHTTFHDVITIGDGKGNYDIEGKDLGEYNNQDDSAAHKGISYDRLKQAGKDVNNKLVIGGFTTKPVKYFSIDFWYTGVPELFYSLMGEANIIIPVTKDVSIEPGGRYMEQFDKGAGDIAGAALNGSLAGLSGPAKGYKDADTVHGKLYAGRLVLKLGPVKLHGGYSRVADEADLIAPWRGFPTGGYTRSMAQYNWEANTVSWMGMVNLDLGKAGLIEGFNIAADYVFADIDEEKEKLGGISSTDRSYIHVDIWYNFPFLPGFQAKIRVGLADDDENSKGKDLSYNEYRFELNYLF